jgi:hypothetical protein
MGKKSSGRAAEAALTESTERALGLSEKLERQTEPARTIPIQKYRQLVSGGKALVSCSRRVSLGLPVWVSLALRRESVLSERLCRAVQH